MTTISSAATFTSSPSPSTSPSTSPSNLTLMIDNYDSFTYNIVQYLAQLGANVVVYRNDEITVDEALALNPINVVISPGPGSPSEAGVSKDIIKAFAGKVPVLGVCLGHQSIIELYGGEIVRCGHIMHGKVSQVLHDGKGVYAGLGEEKTPFVPAAYPSPPAPAFTSSLLATRYHSLIGNSTTLPSSLIVTSYTLEPSKPSVPSPSPCVEEHKSPDTTLTRTIMGVRHVDYTVEGVQFHPESVSTEHGMKMLGNFLRLRGGAWKDAMLL